MTPVELLVTPPESFDRRTPDGRRERGVITSCPFGGRHLVGADFAWWSCPTCAAHSRAERRARSAERLAAKHQAMLARFYPSGVVR